MGALLVVSVSGQPGVRTVVSFKKCPQDGMMKHCPGGDTELWKPVDSREPSCFKSAGALPRK